jgi:tRNA-splicing ligase RtcB (3'-phosphate/5'-hydroxy nucleic acid ligase)
MEQIKAKLYSWASILDPQTRAQACRTASMDFIYPHMALMADAHLGKGATVGSVIPTLGAIMPAAVGVDIGCGMIAVRTQWTNQAFAMSKHLSLTPLREAIERRIPLSPGKYNTVLDSRTRKRVDELSSLDGVHSANEVAGNWHLQLGSLGGGNHFIEIVLDEEDRIWAFLHSGSRGVGNKLAQRHIRVAMNECMGEPMPEGDRDLSYLRDDRDSFWDYIRDLRWAQQFALLNREVMMDRTLDALAEYMGQGPVRESERINCHHNYTTLEHHYGKQVWLSRKGAIAAWEWDEGLIPGSMGAASYVVKGKENRLALCSSPHGAGRQHSRNSARRTFTMDDLEARMRGIEWRHTDAFLDEHPDAYKDIDQVMADSADLVEVKHKFRQLVNVKGE